MGDTGRGGRGGGGGGGETGRCERGEALVCLNSSFMVGGNELCLECLICNETSVTKLGSVILNVWTI